MNKTYEHVESSFFLNSFSTCFELQEEILRNFSFHVFHVIWHAMVGHSVPAQLKNTNSIAKLKMFHKFASFEFDQRYHVKYYYVMQNRKHKSLTRRNLKMQFVCSFSNQVLFLAFETCCQKWNQNYNMCNKIQNAKFLYHRVSKVKLLEAIVKHPCAQTNDLEL